MKGVFMYGVYTAVTVAAAADDPEHTAVRTQVLPAVQATPGAVGGYWLRESATKGASLVLFETEDEARAAIAAMDVKVGGEIIPGVVFDSVEVSEVIAYF
jgi:hypothetical protein